MSKTCRKFIACDKVVPCKSALMLLIHLSCIVLYCVVIIYIFLLAQSINEDSLKRLNSYLEDLQTKKPVNPTHLMFYLKNDTATSLEEGKSHMAPLS